MPPELRKYPVPLAQKMRMLFESEIDHAGGLFVTPVWAVGDLLAHGGDFDKFVRARDIVKQEGVLFKHLLRMVLLCGEFAQLAPREASPGDWQATLTGVSSSRPRAGPSTRNAPTSCWRSSLRTRGPWRRLRTT